MIIRPFLDNDRDSLVALWQECDLVVAHNDPHKDIDRKLAETPDWLLVGEIEGKIIASCMVGYDGHRGWLNYLACDPEHQKNGYARKIVAYAENILRKAGCPKINIQIRTNNQQVIDFYRQLGFTKDEVVSMGKRLVYDEDSKPVGRCP